MQLIVNLLRSLVTIINNDKKSTRKSVKNRINNEQERFFCGKSINRQNKEEKFLQQLITKEEIIKHPKNKELL